MQGSGLRKEPRMKDAIKRLFDEADSTPLELDNGWAVTVTLGLTYEVAMWNMNSSTGRVKVYGSFACKRDGRRFVAQVSKVKVMADA
jgi:hypothetical protein